MWRFSLAGAAALGFLLGFLPSAREARAQTIGQPILLHSADQRVNVAVGDRHQLRFPGGNAIATLAPSAAIPGGGFVVAWQSFAEDGSRSGIFARRYSADGIPLDAADIPVKLSTESNEDFPNVAARPDGGFVVAWSSAAGIDTHVFARRFAADGTALDPTGIQVNAKMSGHHTHPAIAALPNGSFVVTWQSQDGSVSGVFARRIDADGIPLDTGDVPVNVATTHGQHSAVAARPDNSFVVTWMSEGGQDGSGTGISARRFAADGSPLDPAEILVTFDTTGYQGYPTLSARPDGSFVVTWMSPDISNWGVFARRFGVDGVPLDGADVPVNVTTGAAQQYPAVAARPDGSFIVSWQSSFPYLIEGIFARRFAADGSPIDALDVPVRITTLRHGVWPSIATLTDGKTMAIVWWDPNPSHNNSNIFFNRLRVAGTPVARDDTATVNQPNGSVVINVLANDADPDVGDTLTVVAVGTTAGGGNVVINGDNTLTYTPPAGCGLTSDSFTYTIRDSTGKEATATVSVTIMQVPMMSVLPVTGLRLYGQQGGPFPPPHGTYTVSNTGCANLNWDMTRSATWVGRTPVSGTLTPGNSTPVSVYSGVGARPLPAGEHRATARFRNLSNGMGTTDRIVILRALNAYGTNGFETARLLSGASGVTWGSNIGGSGQPGEPDHAGVSLPLASVWWSWTAPTSGRVIFHTVGSTFDTVLAVYTGTAVNALTLVAANDDDPALAPQSRVAFNAVAGTTYRIVVDGKGDATGQVRLNWSMR